MGLPVPAATSSMTGPVFVDANVIKCTGATPPKGAGCGVLLTEGLAAGQDLTGLRIVSPFSEAQPA